MGTKIIPIRDAEEDGAFYFTVDLDGVDYLLNFQFNAREGFWYFDIFDLAGNEIRTGLKVVANYPILRLCKEAIRPPGEILFLNTTEEPDDPLRADLGVNAILAYEQESSLP